VSDVVQANIQALLRQEANGQIFNVGTGQATTIESVARAIDEGLGARVKIEASSKHRAGDVRHCWADLKKSRALLGFEPRIFFPAALHDFLTTAEFTKRASQAAAYGELVERGLIS
jgi:dTDP-L-rhamnose 4-epimerase